MFTFFINSRANCDTGCYLRIPRESNCRPTSGLNVFQCQRRNMLKWSKHRHKRDVYQRVYSIALPSIRMTTRSFTFSLFPSLPFCSHRNVEAYSFVNLTLSRADVKKYCGAKKFLEFFFCSRNTELKEAILSGKVSVNRRKLNGKQKF